MIEHVGEKRGVREFRKHIPWYVRGHKYAAKFRSSIYRMDDSYDVLHALEKFFTTGEIPVINADEIMCRDAA